jgi:hypothetical protein
MDIVNASATVPDYQPARENGLRTLQASRNDLAVVTRTQQMDIELVTAEGDKVTLSLDSRSAGLYAASEYAQTDGTGAMVYKKSELTMGLYQRDMSFTVEGDLNAAELRDINKVVKTLDKMMNRFVNGKLRPMAAQARGLQGLNTIAGMDVHMSFESRTLVAEQRQAAATYDRLGQPSALQTEPPDSGTADPATEADNLADAMVAKIHSAPTAAYRMMPFVNQLLNDYRQQLEDLNRFGRQIMERIGSRLSRVSAENTGNA